MVKQYKLKIFNDLDLPIKYDVLIDGKLCKGVVHNGISLYEFESHEGRCIQIQKENEWGKESKLNTAFMFLFVLDLVWGNVMESENLPLGTDIRIELSQETEIQLSNILIATTSGIKRWIKGTYIQYLMVLVVVLFITFVNIMVSPFPINIVVCVIIAAGTIFFFKKARKRLLRLKTLMEKYVH